jgi:hypothetical protein
MIDFKGERVETIGAIERDRGHACIRHFVEETSRLFHNANRCSLPDGAFLNNPYGRGQGA